MVQCIASYVGNYISVHIVRLCEQNVNTRHFSLLDLEKTLLSVSYHKVLEETM